MAERALPVLVLAAHGECRFSSHRCACCASAASTDAAGRELSLQAGLCTPIDLLEGRHNSVPSLPVLENSTRGDSTKASASYSGVACSGGCGEVFCSAKCEKKFAKSGHQLLCVGPLESLEHPLCVFRRLCGSLGEEVLLGGQLLAAALTELKEEQGCAIGPATCTVRAFVARGLAADKNADRTAASNDFSLSSASKTVKTKKTNHSEKQQRVKNRSKRENTVPEAEEEDEGWEGEAFSALRAGLFEAHGIRPREIAVALGAVQGGSSAESSPAKSADHISAGKRWRALLRQVEQCAVPIELESLASTYCRQAMFSSPAVLAEVENAVTPLLSRIEAKKLAQIQAESGAEAGDDDDDEGDDDGGGWETESSNGDDDSHDESFNNDSAAAAELKEEAPKKQASKRKAASSSLWPVGWNPPLGEKADALLSPWTAIALFPLDHLCKDGDGSSSGVAAAKRGEAVDCLPKFTGPLLMPHFQGDLPHSCLPTHILKVEPCDANAALSSSSIGSISVSSYLGASLEPIPMDQGGCAPSPKSAELSSGNNGNDSTNLSSSDIDGSSVQSGSHHAVAQYSRCYVNASRGRKARARELVRRFGAASGRSQEKGGMEMGSIGDGVSGMGGCSCLRCSWESAALPTSPGSTAAATKDEKGAGNPCKGRSDADVGEAALKAAVLAVTSKMTYSTATAVGGRQSRTTNDVNGIQIEPISIRNVDSQSTDAAWDLLRRLTNQAMHQERYEDALVALAGMRHLKPRNGDALYLTAVALRRMERWSPAKSIAQDNESSPTGDSAAAFAGTAARTRNEHSNSAVAISQLDSRMGAHAFFLAANAVASPPHPLLQAAAAEIIALDVFADHESPSLSSLHVEGNQDDVSSSSSSSPPPSELPPPQAQAQEPLLSQCQPPMPPSSSGESSPSSGSRLLPPTWPVAAVAAACLERKAVAQRTNALQDDDDDTTVGSSADGASEGSGDWEDVDDDDEYDEDEDGESEAKVDALTTEADDLVRSVFVTRASAPTIREERSPTVASGANNGCCGKEEQTEQAHAQDEQGEPRSIMAVPRVLSLRECAWAVAAAEDFAVRQGGWTTQRHYAVPTTDLPLHEVPLLLPWFRDLCKHRIFPLLGALYPNIVGKTDGSQLRINDAFVVKYCAAGQQRHLPLHVDQSTISLTVALNGHDHAKGSAASGAKEKEEEVLPTFAGGGTYFESLGEALVPEPGGLVVFPGDCSHGGMPITGGTRYIIAAFLYVLE